MKQHPRFTMSKFASKQELLEAKAAYFEKEYKKLAEAAAAVAELYPEDMSSDGSGRIGFNKQARKAVDTLRRELGHTEDSSSEKPTAKQRPLTDTQKWIINYLKGRGWCSPTQIGNAYGDSLHGNNGFHSYHSAWASPRCKSLVKRGLLLRNAKGHYCLA